ncbi:MAG: hypothetical protein ACK5ND_03885 [Bacteroides sp.]
MMKTVDFNFQASGMLVGDKLQLMLANEGMKGLRVYYLLLLRVGRQLYRSALLFFLHWLSGLLHLFRTLGSPSPSSPFSHFSEGLDPSSTTGKVSRTVNGIVKRIVNRSVKRSVNRIELRSRNALKDSDLSSRARARVSNSNISLYKERERKRKRIHKEKQATSS